MSPTTNNLTELMATDPPRLVVLYQRDERGEEQFQYGVMKSMPLLTVIGAIVRVQAELPLLEPGDARHHCDQHALVLAWDAAARRVHWFVGPDAPVDPLVGMLETIKTRLVDAVVQQRAARQPTNRRALLGPDGAPFRG